MKTKILPVLLALCMIFTLIPSSAFADESIQPETATEVAVDEAAPNAVNESGSMSDGVAAANESGSVSDGVAAANESGSVSDDVAAVEETAVVTEKPLVELQTEEIEIVTETQTKEAVPTEANDSQGTSVNNEAKASDEKAAEPALKIDANEDQKNTAANAEKASDEKTAESAHSKDVGTVKNGASGNTDKNRSNVPEDNKNVLKNTKVKTAADDETITVTIHANTREGVLDVDHAPIVCDSVPKGSTYSQAMAYIKDTEGSNHIDLNYSGYYLHAMWNTKQPLSTYSSNDEAYADRFQNGDVLNEDTDIYIPYRIISYEINVEAPECGTVVTDGYPGTTVTAPEGALWGDRIDNHWVQGSNNPANFNGTIEGGKKYINFVILELPWGYTSTSGTVSSASTVTVNGGEFVRNWFTDANRYGFFISVEAEHDWEFDTIEWADDCSTAKAVYQCGDHSGTVDCEVTKDDSDPKKTVYTATVSAEDSLDVEEHTDEKTVYTVYNLYVQGVHVTGENCDDILGDGTVSFDPEAVKLTLNNANIEMSRRSYGYETEDKNEYGIRSNLKQKDNLPGSVAVTGTLTIEILGNNTIANNTPDAGTTDKYGLIVFGNDVTFTGGGSLDISMTADESRLYHGIETRANTIYDGVTVNVNIDGNNNAVGEYLQYTNTIALKNRAQVHINVGKGYALDNNVQGNEDLSVDKGCTFVAVSENGPAALHGNNWVKIAQDTVDNRGVLVNADPADEGRTAWDGTTEIANYKYVYIPGRAVVTLHWSSIDGVDLMDPIEVEVTPGTTFLDVLKKVNPDAETTMDGVFEKEGYDHWLYTSKPMTEYADEAALWGDKLDDEDVIYTDMDVYCCMFTLIPEANVTVTPPACGTTTETPDKTYPYDSQTNPPEFTVDTEHVYVNRSGNHLPGHWLTDANHNHIFEGTFKGGESYYADMTISAEYGYCFNDDLKLTLNGADFESLFIAAENYEFYAKVTVEHDPAEPVTENEVAPTCEKAGSHDEVVYCKNHETCGYEFSRETVADPATGHDWDEGKMTKEPTCTEEGEKTYTCKNDANHIKTEKVKALGHEWGKWIVINEPTCNETGVESRTCENDAEHVEYREIAALGHNWGDPTYEWADDNSSVTATRICKNDPSHVETETVRTTSEITKEPTATEEGERTYTAIFKNQAFETQTKTEPTEKLSYRNTVGDGNVWTKGSKNTSDFIFKRSINDEETFSHFIGIKVDGKDVDESSFIAEAGSVIVKLKPEFLETLSVGKHTLTALFDDGNNVTVNFEIVAKKEVNPPKKVTPSKNNTTVKKTTKSPKTGDGNNTALYIVVMLLALGVVSATLFNRRRKMR